MGEGEAVNRPAEQDYPETVAWLEGAAVADSLMRPELLAMLRELTRLRTEIERLERRNDSQRKTLDECASYRAAYLRLTDVYDGRRRRARVR